MLCRWQSLVASPLQSSCTTRTEERSTPRCLTSLFFGKRLEDEGLVPSMGRAGSAYDNTLAEFFVATLKTELLYRSS
jgi:hypothetical protein